MFATGWTLGPIGSEEALSIRRAVFIEELGQTAETVFDGRDELAAHLTVRLDGKAIASARLCPDAGGVRFAFIGVLAPYRRQGFGDLCARVMLDKAQRMGAARICADVPEQYAPYYEAFGFTAQGDAADGVLPMAVDGSAIHWHSPCKDGH